MSIMSIPAVTIMAVKRGRDHPRPLIRVTAGTASLGRALATETVSDQKHAKYLGFENGWTHLTVSRTSSPAEPFVPFSWVFFSPPTNKCRFLVLQPSIFMNWSNSRTRRLQQL